MQTKNEVHAIIQDLKKKLPSFSTIPVTSEEQARAMDEKKIMGAFVIQEGEFKDHIIVLREIEAKGDNLTINYNAFDSEKNNVESDSLNIIVGDAVNYLLALEKLKEFDTEDN